MAPMIEVSGLCKAFGTKQVLQDLNLQVEARTICVILGSSGVGKSVLMKHLIGLLKPDAGEIHVDGVNIVALGDKELNQLRRSFGMVFQFAALFDSLTVFENVAFPLREHSAMRESEIKERVLETLAVVGLAGEEESYPAELSGGMRKRVGVARAVIMHPKILLWDEPTTGLDPIATDAVDELILRMREVYGVTSVVISHDIASSFKVADKIAVLHQGYIIEYGTPVEVRHSAHPQVQKFLSYWFAKN